MGLETHRVLVWIVLGPPAFDVADLEGRFVRKSSPAGEAVDGNVKEGLIGGADDAVVLVPPSGREQIPGNAALTVLELDLSAMKV